MRRYLTLDGGTTNTRIRLVCDGEIIDVLKIPKGARSDMEAAGSLERAVREAIALLLSKNNLVPSDIERILASGMVTSEFGLCPLAHTVAPAGIRELHESMHEVVLSDITPIPFVFIRGVKLAGESLRGADMMRGEETELIGIADGVANTLYVLPGSHSKLVLTDSEGRISDFSTMLTGEMIYALASSTILKDAVDLSLCEMNTDNLGQGYAYAREYGLNEALFKVRILKNLFGADPIACYSFFLGAVLADEIEAIAKSEASRIVIGGREQIKRATSELLTLRGIKKEIVLLDEEMVDRSTSLGMIRIFEYSNK